MKKVMLLLVGLLLTWSLPAGAVLIDITDIDSSRSSLYEEDYAEFVNSGDLLGVFKGNDSNQLGDIESWLIDNADGFEEGLILTESFKTEFEESTATKSGTWSTLDPIQLYMVKAGNAFALYEVYPSDDSGFWSTYDLWLRGLGGNDGIVISHLTGASAAPAPVPEPATMLLLGTGLMGMAGLGRKKLIKK